VGKVDILRTSFDKTDVKRIIMASDMFIATRKSSMPAGIGTIRKKMIATT
jgi:hypothetical protein